MKIHFKHLGLSAIALAFAVSTPASAQLLGGGGGGGLTGGLTGTVQQTTGSVTGSSTGSLRGEKQVDRKSGRVGGNGSATSNNNGSVTGGTTVLDRSVNGTSDGSANASKSGSVDAQLIGTDAVRGAAQDGVGRARGTLDSARSTAGSAVGQARGLAGNAAGSASGAGSIAGSGNGMFDGGVFEGGLGQLAASGSAAANGNGMFAIEPGMPIEDARGRTIGYVQQVQQTKQGVVEAVTVEVGNRTATLPAANFSGQGEALVTGMSKGELKSAAKEQDAQGSNQGQSATEPSNNDSAPKADNRARSTDTRER